MKQASLGNAIFVRPIVPAIFLDQHLKMRVFYPVDDVADHQYLVDLSAKLEVCWIFLGKDPMG